MPAERMRFQAVQKQMTDWLREPDARPAPAVELRRLTIYRELFFNNVRDFVEASYPILKSLLPASEWDALVARFFAEHRCQSPYFRDISLEFRSWMESARAEWLAKHPWAVELMHYEWVELAADCAEAGYPEAGYPETEVDTTGCQPDGDLLGGIPLVSACVWPLVYRWPVHRLGVDNPPAFEPPAQPVCLLVYRDADDDVRFLEVNTMSARLVELMQARDLRSGRELLQQLAAEAGYAPANVEAFVQAGAAMLETLRDNGVIRGTRLNIL